MYFGAAISASVRLVAWSWLLAVCVSGNELGEAAARNGLGLFISQFAWTRFHRVLPRVQEQPVTTWVNAHGFGCSFGYLKWVLKAPLPVSGLPVFPLRALPVSL